MMELVDFNDNLLDGGSTKKKARRRTKKKPSAAEAAIQDVDSEEVIEAENEAKEETKTSDSPEVKKDDSDAKE